jgi:GTP1/Obg family GTP-binding protein
MPPDSSQQQYSRLAGKMISMVNELRATGADVALELPTIVVCGQQSAGKSSVVEVRCSCQK